MRNKILAIAAIMVVISMMASMTMMQIPVFRQLARMHRTATPTEANDDTLSAMTSNGNVLVDFYATWCGPCKAVAPELEIVADKLAGKLRVVKVDCDKSPKAAKEYDILAIPKILLFKDGKLVEECPERNADKIIEWLKGKGIE